MQTVRHKRAAPFHQVIKLMQVMAACVLAVGCAGTKTTFDLSKPGALNEVFPITASQADFVLMQAMSAGAGASMAPLPPPTIGYRGSITFGLDTHTFTAIAVPVEYAATNGLRSTGYAFEVNHSGTFLISGPARASTIYTRLIQSASQIAAPVKLTAKEFFDGRKSIAGNQSSSSDSADPNRVKGSGSGFFLTEDGYLVTNHHVVRKAKKVMIRHEGKEYPATIVKWDESNDLAILKVEGRFKSLPLASSADVKLGQGVFTVGYPNPPDQGVSPKMTDGRISSLMGLRDSASNFQISVPIQPGNSGGPLVNEKGLTIGVVVSTLNPGYALRNTGTLPQNVNFAVKSDYILVLVKNIPQLKDKLGVAVAAQGSTVEENVEQVAKGTALVVIY